MDRSSSVEDLRRRLREAEERAEEAEREQQEERQRAEREQQRAEREQQRAEREQQRAEREQQRAEEAEEQTRPTTLDEYISACHTSVFSKLTVETDPKLSSTGSITNPRHKWCPTNLRPWSDFLQQQRLTFGLLYETFPTETRAFENRNFLVGLGNRISRRSIADEKTLEYFLHNRLKEVDEVRSVFDLGNGIIFENHPHAISDVAEEVYKPPHKLTAPHLRLGLRAMNIYEEVVNRKTIPTSVDPDARFQYHAERLTAGLENDLLTTGEVIVFLRIDWDEPGTLFYHLAEPNAEVSAHPDHFHILMALDSPGEGRQHVQDERQRATQELKTWVEDFETTLRSIPEDERHAPKSSPGYQPVDYIGNWKRVEDEPIKRPTRKDGGEPSDDESGPHMPDTPSPTERRSGRGGRGEQGGQGTRRSRRILERRPQGGGGGGRGGRGGNNEQEVPFCTQKCLLGLVRGGTLDPRCNNHRSNRHGSRRTCAAHPIAHTDFVELLREQLERTLDDGITPLASGGTRGVLFKVTLLAYGYTFVSKGTVRAFMKDLEHEAAVYERLQPVQGVHVPVLLGAVDLHPMGRIYYYDHRVYVGMAMRSLRAIHQRGVVHRDTNGVMIIDVERALLLEPPRHPWKAETVDPSKATEKSRIRGRDEGRCSDDIRMVTAVFRARDVQQGITFASAGSPKSPLPRSIPQAAVAAKADTSIKPATIIARCYAPEKEKYFVASGWREEPVLDC
ncbi:hypothetical protein B0J13DRAFT_600437 [Dactylonectria estremocensis]|uniref:Protein kinase domain-containing protein n=1 Tax=Dactylonectria estremocensis TaxID=1079267 RepID=A0A9P9D3D2_9HYPO|nr:hypothetical protein B0J13DRAFT_600437 [Dactylonectria estremocensis]